MADETISKKILIAKGYTSYDKNLFQKRVYGEKGIKYHINCQFIPLLIKGTNQNWWEFEMQINTINGAVNIKTVQWFNKNGIHSKNRIEDVENYFEWLFKLHGEPYYEKN
jgi:hypothetical protein